MNIPQGVLGAVRAVRDATLYDPKTKKILPMSPIAGMAQTKPGEEMRFLSDPNNQMAIAGMVGSVNAVSKLPQTATSISRTVPTKMLNLSDDFGTAIENVTQGKLSKSKLPILAVSNSGGTYDVLDGNHRLAKAMQSGARDVEIITDEKAYRKLADLEDKYINSNIPRFIRGEGGRFAGSTSVMPKYANPLTQEARKYKSAEEWLSDNMGNQYFYGKQIPPTAKIEAELAKYKPTKPVTLYRGIREGEKQGGKLFESWTTDPQVATDFANGGKVIKKTFNPDDIIVDTNLLPPGKLQELGNMTNEREVIIWNKANKK